MNIQIPGFFYDPVKKKYFKITNQRVSAAQSSRTETTHTASSSAVSSINNYSINSIRSSQKDITRNKRKQVIQETINSKLTNYETKLLGVHNLIYPTYDLRNELSDYKIRKLQRDGSLDHITLSLNDKPRLISPAPYNEQIIYVSTLNNIHKITDRGHLSEQLIHHRTDKSIHSTLRGFQVSNNEELTVRQWLEDNDKSEVEILNLANGTQSRIFSEDREWFNSMLLDEENNNNKLLTAGNNSLNIYDLQRHNKGTRIKSKNDITCLERSCKSVPNSFMIGTRNGQLQRADLRTGSLQNLSYQLTNHKRDTSSKNKARSITNVKAAGLNELIVSTLGDTLVKFDQRNLSQPVISFNSLKNTHDIFNESLSLHNDRYLVSANNSCGTIEIFNVYEQISLINIDTSKYCKELTNPFFNSKDELVCFNRDTSQMYKFS